MPSGSIGITASGSNPLPVSFGVPYSSSITTTGMTLNSDIVNSGHSTIVQFEYGTSPTLSTFTTVTADQSPLTGSSLVTATRSISGLIYNGVYYFRTVVTTAGVQVKSAIGSQQLYAVPSWTDSTLARPRLNTVYSDSVSAYGLPAPTYSISSGSLPAGLTLNSTTGAITGTPTNTEQYTFQIRASNIVGSQTATYTILVSTGIEGGTEYNTGGVRVHEFTGAGSLTSYMASPRSVVVFITGGGGSGGSSVGGGGGAGKWGGGSFFIAPNAPISCTIGAGGARQTSYFGGQGFDGASSTLTTPTISGYQTGATYTLGGGGGGGFYNANAPTAGTSKNVSTEGSGGGGSGGVNGAFSLGGTGYTNGGQGRSFVNGRYVAGGGGGHQTGGSSGDASTGVSGRGGDGAYLDAANRNMGGGGGGGGDAIGAAGSAGDVAGTSGNTTGTSAPANTGSGGGGCRNASGGVSSGAGGSGVLVVYYLR